MKKQKLNVLCFHNHYYLYVYMFYDIVLTRLPSLTPVMYRSKTYDECKKTELFTYYFSDINIENILFFFFT